MQPLKSMYKQMMQLLHTSPKPFIRNVLLTLIPFIILSASVNIHFYRVQYDNMISIAKSVTLQAASRLNSLYQMAAGISQNIASGSVIQKEIAASNGGTDYQMLNRNILKLRSLIKTYLFFDEISSIRFYLPDEMIIADGNTLFYDTQRTNTAWYRDYQAHTDLRRWYVTDVDVESADQMNISVVTDIRDPLDYLRVMGSLSVDFRRSDIENIIKGSTIDERTESYLVDSLGDTVLHLGVMNESLDWAQLEIDFAKETWPDYVKLAGEAYLLICEPMSATGMYLINLVPQSSITSNNLINYTYQVLLMILEIIMVVCLTAMLAYTSISSKNNRLKLLNQQINPHFLYNALDMINWKAIDRNMQEICRPIQKLSRFYKLTLNHGLDYITLREEFDQLSIYLSIQDERFGNRMTYKLHYEPELGDCVILHMILQPIVENAILHGLMEQEGQTGLIAISAVRSDNDILVTIDDNGVGMDEATISELLKAHDTTGFGLSSVEERMHLYYKRKYGIKIRSRLGEGTTVEVCFPIRMEREQP